jgi:hypothetical protein
MELNLRRYAFAFLDGLGEKFDKFKPCSVDIPSDRRGKEFETITATSLRPLNPINPDLSGGPTTKPGSAMAVHGGDASNGTAFGPAPHVTAAQFSAEHAPKADPFDIGDAS